MTPDPKLLKIEAAQAALNYVESGMKLGLGTGSTADEFVRLLALKVAAGFDIIGVATSERTANLCHNLNIPLSTLEQTPELDLTVDGADEVGPGLSLIKGGGGALLREKIVAAASRRMIVIADESKLVETLGRFPLPIEVNPFGLAATKRAIILGAQECGLAGPVLLREKDDQPFMTDGGHFILDASFGLIQNPVMLSRQLLQIPGVVDHGLFIGIADLAIIAGPNGVKILEADAQ